MILKPTWPEFIPFQQRLTADCKGACEHKGLGLTGPGATDPATGERLNLGQFCDRYQMTLWLLFELEKKHDL